MALALSIVAGLGGYLVGNAHAPSRDDANRARQDAFADSYAGALREGRNSAHQRALTAGTAAGHQQGQTEGSQAGSDDGDNDAADEIAASQPPPAPSAPAPGTVDQFGIVRPAPGVSPEYDNCIAQGGTPSPDGCLP